MIAAAVLAAQLMMPATGSTPALTGEASVSRTDSWAIIDKVEADNAHRAHEAHVLHEEHVREEAQEPRSLPMPPFHAVSSTPSGYKPSPAVSEPPGGTSTSTVSTEGMGAVEACIIQAESGGNPQIWNASGHYGLFQFSESTWEAAGGSAAMFGNAPASYQEQLFWNIADQGIEMIESTWTDYDGCTP